MNTQYEPGYDADLDDPEEEEVEVKCTVCSGPFWVMAVDAEEVGNVCRVCDAEARQRAEDDAHYRRTGYSPYDF